jgi:hypothetical protein
MADAAVATAAAGAAAGGAKTCHVLTGAGPTLRG